MSNLLLTVGCLMIGIGFALGSDHNYLPAIAIILLATIVFLLAWFNSPFLKKYQDNLNRSRGKYSKKPQSGRRYVEYFSRKRNYGWLKWGLCIPIIFLCFPCAYYEYNEQSKYAEVQLTAELQLPYGVLTPANDPNPPLPQGCQNMSLATNTLKIFFGNSLSYANEFPHSLITVDGHSLISINRDAQGGISLSADVRDSTGKVITEISNNQFEINPNNTLNPDNSRPDEYTLSVMDQYGNQALYFRYLNPGAVEILGSFYYAPNQGVIIGTSTQLIAGATMSGNCFGDNGTDIDIE
jgi:hypothetical protein